MSQLTLRLHFSSSVLASSLSALFCFSSASSASPSQYFSPLHIKMPTTKGAKVLIPPRRGEIKAKIFRKVFSAINPILAKKGGNCRSKKQVFPDQTATFCCGNDALGKDDGYKRKEGKALIPPRRGEIKVKIFRKFVSAIIPILGCAGAKKGGNCGSKKQVFPDQTATFCCVKPAQGKDDGYQRKEAKVLIPPRRGEIKVKIFRNFVSAISPILGCAGAKSGGNCRSKKHVFPYQTATLR